MNLFIGCSGFHYRDWAGKFYPEQLPKKEWLEYYAGHFNTVEINNTFYKMPEEKTLLNWKSKTPADFKFTIKANRFFTHQKKLNTDDIFRERYYSFIDTVSKLGEKLGCILWQLPANQGFDPGKLDRFCRLSDKNFSHVIEFRHLSWFEKETYDILREHGIGFCMLSAPKPLPEEVTATSATAYLRYHGKTNWYNYHYSESELDVWVQKLQNLQGAAELYIYFNNDHQAWAVENARYLMSQFK
jgi:uncharacterized protein YecE (DUF72 family)